MASAKEGIVPLPVRFDIEAYLQPRQRMTYKLTDTFDGGWTEGGGMAGDHAGWYGAGYSIVTLVRPGNVTFTIDARIDDASYVLTWNVSARGSLDVHARLASDCTLCSGGIAGEEFALGESGCTAFECWRHALSPEWAGYRFEVDSQADPDLAFMDRCEGPLRQELHISDGPQHGTVPEWAGCVVVWLYEGAPGSFHALVYTDRV